MPPMTVSMSSGADLDDPGRSAELPTRALRRMGALDGKAEKEMFQLTVAITSLIVYQVIMLLSYQPTMKNKKDLIAQISQNVAPALSAPPPLPESALPEVVERQEKKLARRTSATTASPTSPTTGTGKQAAFWLDDEDPPSSMKWGWCFTVRGSSRAITWCCEPPFAWFRGITSWWKKCAT